MQYEELREDIQIGQREESNNKEIIKTVNAPMMERGDPNLIRWQLDNQDLVADFIHNLNGEEMDEEGNWIKIKDKSLMNPKGCNNTKTFLAPVVSKAVIMSDLKQDEIHQMAEAHTHKIINHYAINYKEYGIKKDNLPLIIEAIDTFTTTTLMRAKDGGERKFLSQTEKRVETYNEASASKGKNGFLEKFKI